MRKIYIFCLFFVWLCCASQVKPATQDTVKTGFSVGKVQLKIQEYSLLLRMIPFQIDTSIQVHWMAFLLITPLY
jgi:hypothetical protein